MSIMAIGGSGFIGSHVVDALIEKGHQVVIYDIETPKHGQVCDYVKGDVLDLQRLVAATKGIDVIYNLAAEANVNRFFESPLYSNAVTSQGALNVFEAARQNAVRRVIFASTEWVYGSAAGDDETPVVEEAHYARNPDHVYTSSKIAAELFMKNYQRLYGVNYTIMRYGIPFGERARPATVTPIFINKILNDDPITIHGDGSQTRQFIYVKDLARGNAACLSERAENEIFNLNGTRQISVLEIVRTLEKIMGKKANITFVEDRAGNFRGRFISSEKAKRLLGWEPQFSYEEAMQHYVQWFIENEKN